MSLNRYMHPSNPYKRPPDFQHLAKQYPEFSGALKTDLNGKVSVDFKDPGALRLLTETLLKEDFDLTAKIPADRLVPALPLRMNYICWLEDLLKLINRCDGAHGIDVGAGAIAIYSLLAAKRNKWRMLATDTSTEAANHAKATVEANGLQDYVSVLPTDPSSPMFPSAPPDGQNAWDFSLCNPPFFDSRPPSRATDDGEGGSVGSPSSARSRPGRPPPPHAPTGSVSEMSTDGGELAFVTRMIEESKTKAALVRIYTTMVGHKYNLKRLEQVLKSLRCPRWTATEFCQGRTMRWGLAWSWDAKCLLDKAPPPLRPSKISTIKPIVHEVKENPSLFVYTVPSVYDFLTNALIRISLALDEKVRSDLVAKTDFYARDNTWSGQRKKKREKLRAKEGQAQGEPAKERLSAESLQDLSPARSSSLGGKKRVRGALEAEEDEDSAMASPSKRPREGLEEDFDAMFDSCSSALPTPPEYLVHGRLVVKRQGGRIHLELSYLEGNGGKEAVAQIQQFLKNHLSGVYATAGGGEKADTAMEVE